MSPSNRSSSSSNNNNNSYSTSVNTVTTTMPHRSSSSSTSSSNSRSSRASSITGALRSYNSPLTEDSQGKKKKVLKPSTTMALKNKTSLLESTRSSEMELDNGEYLSKLSLGEFKLSSSQFASCQSDVSDGWFDDL